MALIDQRHRTLGETPILVNRSLPLMDKPPISQIFTLMNSLRESLIYSSLEASWLWTAA
jgi:hypothetical protein